MLREGLDQPFRTVSWEEALDFLVRRLRRSLEKLGPDGIAVYGSGQLQTEDYYVAQKLLKGCLGSNHFDANSRLCMASAVSAYVQTFGADGPPCCYEDLDLSDCVFLVGSNTAHCHPVLFHRLQARRRKDPDLRLVVIDPRRTETAEEADLHLAIRPGTDIDLFHGLAHILVRDGGIDTDFVARGTRGFEDLLRLLPEHSPEVVAQRCGVSVEGLEAAAGWWRDSEKVLSLWSMGLNQSSEGTAKVRSLLNLHLLSGQLGRPGAGPFSLTGQPNAMGGREAGGLCHLLPGYRQVENEAHRREIEDLWGLPRGRIQSRRGRTAWEMIEALEEDRLGVFWVVATNPAVSLPHLGRVRRALARSPLTVVQDAYEPTETGELAHLLLPAAAWGEKTGTMTNSERVVTLCPAFRPPPGEARADWEIFTEVGRRLGFERELTFASPAEVFAELARLSRGRPCDFSGLSHRRLAEEGPLPWPSPEGQAPGAGESRRLYQDLQFPTADGRARFFAAPPRGLAEAPSEEYPLTLTNGRLLGHWHTLTRTGRIERLRRMHPEPYLEIHPEDARRRGIGHGEQVEVRSARGKARIPAHLDEGTPEGTVFLPMHWGALWAEEAEVNALTHPEACPHSWQPELKACAVEVERVNPP
jgi:ferredoxin-nitrate reductase